MAETWTRSLGTLLTTQAAREVVAEVLEAAISVLRRVRDTGQRVADGGGGALESATSSASKAVGIGTEAVSGAIEATGEVASAATGIVQTAAESLVTLATNAVRELLPEGSPESDDTTKRRARRKRP